MAKKYIDAEQLKQTVETSMDMQDLYLPSHFFDVIDGIQAADVVEVVRCKDCKYAKPHNDDFWIKNNAPLLCEKYDWYVENDGYWSEGELKNG